MLIGTIAKSDKILYILLHYADTKATTFSHPLITQISTRFNAHLQCCSDSQLKPKSLQTENFIISFGSKCHKFHAQPSWADTMPSFLRLLAVGYPRCPLSITNRISKPPSLVPCPLLACQIHLLDRSFTPIKKYLSLALSGPRPGPLRDMTAHP